MRKWSTAFLVGTIWLALGTLPWVSASQGLHPLSQTVAVISSPRDNAILRERVVIIGSADDPNFWKYEVHYAREPVGSNWVLIGVVHERPVRDGVLETWDTTLVPDGAYSLRLRVVRKDGNYTEQYVRGLSVANAQPTETPTPEVTPTPTISPTPLPATPTIVIQQPVVSTPLVQPTPTPGPAAESTAQATSAFSFNPERLGGSFCYGSLVAVVVFLVIGVLALLRKFFQRLWRLVRRR